MIVQYAIVGLAVLAAIIYVARRFAAAWRGAGCPSGGCAGCDAGRAGCPGGDRLVQLKRTPR